MPNLTALSATTTAATALSNLVLVSPQSTVGYQPQNRPNPDGSVSVASPPPRLLFNYEGEQTTLLESDITDHYVEDNSAVQDQISLKPEVITTHGFIGELNDVVPDLLKLVKFAADKLTTVVAYQPKLTTTAELVYAEAFQLYQVASNVINTAVNTWAAVGNAITGSDGQSVIGANGLTIATAQNKQQTAFQQFYGYWKNRTLFTVQTPWAVFQNMAIRSLRAIQDAETRVITDFEITFKMIRNVATITNNGFSVDASLQGRASTQNSALQDLGSSTGVPGPSLGSGLSTMGVA